MANARRAPDRELLLSRHSFPGKYDIKAFGPGEASFEISVVTIAHETLSEERVTSAIRRSGKGRRMCVSLELHAETVDEIILVYERLYDLDSLMLIL